ncbi:hypothetical protein ACHAXT_009465 [Thalassiosira profunda]
MASASPLRAPASSAAGAAIDPALEEQLTALLASPDFSVPAYLNLALAPPPDDTEKASPEEEEQRLEQRMASLALQLQMRTQGCHDEMGRIGAELQAVVPRCAADVGRLKVGLEGMELDVRGLLEGMDDGQSAQNDGAGDDAAGVGEDPLATLHSLLNLRTHLTTARAILSAASSWDETINSIPMLLSTTPPNLVEAVAALSQLEQGARALRGMPEGRDEREAALSKLRTQLEVLLKPQLLHALKRMDTRLGPLQQCVSMYNSLGKTEALREEYVKMRPAEVHALWFSFSGGNPSSHAAVEKEEGKGEEGSKGEKEGEDEEVEDFVFDEDTEAAAPAAAPASAQQFLEFLPAFYEAALELLAKERTQARQVFGPELAPSIAARVLIECFRPLVSSFARRLAHLCPVPGRGARASGMGGADGMGGTEAIATTYESTIQFLSLAYDQMEAWEPAADEGQDAKTAGASTANGAWEAVREAFLLVAAPYAPYQRQWAAAEQDPLGEAAAMVAKDVRGAAASFDDAAERMGDLAPFVFPLAEAAVQRFARLTGGHNVPATLASLDGLIATHASELAIAVGTLSTHAAAGGAGAEFDERRVHCALEILRIAGVFKRNLLSFERSVRDRLRALSVEMEDAALEAKSGRIPDELSPVQIRSMLAKEACDPYPTLIDDGTGAKCPAPAVELRRLAGPPPAQGEPSYRPPPLFPQSLDAAARLAKSCRACVFEVCSAVPERHLRGLSALPVWRQEGGSDGDDDAASYGTLPQPYITQVGEHMLALVQALEPFASDREALGLANEVMDGVREVAVQPWKEFVAAAGCTNFADRDERSKLEGLMRGNDLSKYFGDDGEEEDDAEDNADEHEEEEEPDADAKASAAFCNQWLDAVGLAVTGRLLERTMRIPRLGRTGAEHLATDLEYVRNVFAALGVAGHPHPVLGYVAGLVALDDDALRSKIRRRRKEADASGEAEAIRRVELRIAYVRSISV